MKKILALIAIAFAAIGSIHAQNDVQKAAAEAALALTAADQVEAPVEKPKYWSPTFLGRIDFGQTSFTNWAAGGFNSVTLGANVDASLNYARGKASWTNRLQLDYGFLYSQDKPIIQKNKDRIYFESKYAYVVGPKFRFTTALDFLTQFDNNYSYGTPANPNGGDPTVQEWLDARVLKSGFLSPGYLNLGVGMDWSPGPWLTVNFSPLTGGYVFVLDEQLRHTYGMKLKREFENHTGDILDHMYRPYRFELGAKLKADLKLQINDNVRFASQLVLFSDYLDHPWPPRVNWDNDFSWQLTRFFGLSLKTWMIYDPKVMIAGKDGVEKVRLQFKEFVGLGFSLLLPYKK